MFDFIKLILQQAQENPDHICIVENAKSITYSEFLKVALKIASFLKSKEYKKVVLNIGQGSYAYATIVAVQMIGGSYCPLYPDSPISRKQFIASTFGCDLIINETSELIEGLNDVSQISLFDILSDSVPEEIFRYNPESISSESIAYVIFTSGSTGDPKGVIIQRKALSKFLEWSISAYRLTQNDKWAQYSFLSFDLSIVDIFTSLCSGATLISIANQGDKLRPSVSIESQKITVWHSVPSVIDFMMRADKSKPVSLSSIRIMSFCGESLYQYQLEFLFSKNPNMTIFNTYGPTEGTLFCTYVEINKGNYLDFIQENTSIGSAIPGWNLSFSPLEEDAAKELIIYGEYIGHGYLNSANTSFTQITIGGKPVRAFVTGDIVNEIKGKLYFRNRKDNQIKLRGHRIDLGEIDSHIQRLLKKRCVSLLSDNAIHTFIEDEGFEEKGLRDNLETLLEPYKIPSYFHPIKELPRNTNAKVDINSLKTILNGQS